jgi:hypothetical protein
MNFVETSRTIVAGRRVVVNGSEAISGFPLVATNASAALPSYSFSNETTTGMYITVGGDMTMSVGGVNTWAVSPNANVALCGGAPINYGTTTPGVGVTYLADAATNPGGAPNGGSGGLLYVDDAALKYTDSAGVEVALTSLAGDVTGPGSSVANHVARFNGTTGKILENSGGFLLGADAVQLATGDVPAAPTYGFGSDATSGMYSPAVNELAFSTGGARRFHSSMAAHTSDQNVLLTAGSVGTLPLRFASGNGMFLNNSSVSFVGGGSIGMSVAPSANIALAGPLPANYALGEGVVFIHEVVTPPTAASTGGVVLWVSGTSLMMMTPASSTPVELTACVEGPASAIDNSVVRFDGPSGERVKDTVNVTVADTGEVSAAAGTAALPTYTFLGETSTGMYSAAADTLNFSISGVLNTTIDTAAITSTSRVLCPDGTRNLPGMAWNADLNTGFYLTGSGGVAATSGGDVCFVASPNANLTLAGTEASSYGGGAGVIFLAQASVNPSGTAANRGILYIPSGSVNDLAFYDDSPATTTITGRISGPDSSTNGGVVRWNGATGRVVDASVVTVSASGEVLGPDGDASTPTYSMVGDTDTGMAVTAANTLAYVVGGSSVMNITTSAVDLLQPVHVPGGTVGAPSISFTSDPSSGLFHPAANQVQMVGGGTACLTAVLGAGAAISNITLCSGNVDFGVTEGQRVVLIDDVTVPPSGTALGGGRLYVSGTSLYFHDDGGGAVNISGLTSSTIGSSTDRAVVRYNGVSGAVQESGFFINSPDALDFPGTGTAGAPTFSFSSDPTSGLYWSSSNAASLTTAGTDRITMSSAGVTLPAQALHADTTLEVGGANGALYSITGVNAVANVRTSSTGTFAWSNNAGAIMNTTAGLNLALSNNLLLTNGPDTLSIGHNGTEFGIDSSGTPLGIDLQVDATAVLSMNGTHLVAAGGTTTILERVLAWGGGNNFTYDYTFYPNNRGITRTSTALMLGFGVTKPLFFNARNNISWCGEGSYGNMQGGIFINNVATIPSGAQPSVAMTMYLERTTGVFGLGGYTQTSRTVLDGARERATITLGALSVTTSTDTNTDGQAWTSTDSYGVNGTSTGQMAASDDCFVCFTATAEWAANATGYRRLSIMRKTAGPSYATLNSVTAMAVDGAVAAATDELTVQVHQSSGGDLSVDLRASFVRYETAEAV